MKGHGLSVYGDLDSLGRVLAGSAVRCWLSIVHLVATSVVELWVDGDGSTVLAWGWSSGSGGFQGY